MEKETLDAQVFELLELFLKRSAYQQLGPKCAPRMSRDLVSPMMVQSTVTGLEKTEYSGGVGVG